MSSGITHSFPWLSQTGGYVSTYYCPFRRWSIATPARLACLIHAANVHSEPESNPSIFAALPTDNNRSRRRRVDSQNQNRFDQFLWPLLPRPPKRTVLQQPSQSCAGLLKKSQLPNCQRSIPKPKNSHFGAGKPKYGRPSKTFRKQLTDAGRSLQVLEILTIGRSLSMAVPNFFQAYLRDAWNDFSSLPGITFFATGADPKTIRVFTKKPLFFRTISYCSLLYAEAPDWFAKRREKLSKISPAHAGCRARVAGWLVRDDSARL
jgi:hypothetical protein